MTIEQIDIEIQKLKDANMIEIIKNHGVGYSSAKIIEHIKDLERLKIKLALSLKMNYNNS
jgi:hypothetical protein